MTGYTLDLWRFDPKFNTKVEKKVEPIKKVNEPIVVNKPVVVSQPIVAKLQIEVLAALSYLNTNEAIIKYNGNIYLWKDGKTNNVEILVEMEINEQLKDINFLKINSIK
jgi:hypothetical protein